MKAVISMAIGGLYVSAKQVKPFNPLLGETFEASFPGKDITIHVEHTSHHPPIANFLIVHKNFKFHGRYVFNASLDGNQLNLHQEGPNHVDFNDGQRISFYWAPLRLSGMLWSDRTCKYVNYIKFVDEKNKIKAIVNMGDRGDREVSKKRTDVFSGKIYKYEATNDALKKKKLIEMESKYGDLTENICDLYGSWIENLVIDNKEHWNIDKDLPTPYTPVENPLCSDCRYREDLIWVKRNNFKFAEEWKLKTEERQRYEKKLRVDYAKAQKKK
jgi:hypothetical protein